MAYYLIITVFLLFGCSGIQGSKMIELDGNPTTGYKWVYNISREGIIREVSSEFLNANNDGMTAGSPGKFVFSFKAVSEGETELHFSYLRVWEEGVPAANTVIYKAVVDNRKKLTLTQIKE